LFLRPAALQSTAQHGPGAYAGRNTEMSSCVDIGLMMLGRYDWVVNVLYVLSLCFLLLLLFSCKYHSKYMQSESANEHKISQPIWEQKKVGIWRQIRSGHIRRFVADRTDRLLIVEDIEPCYGMCTENQIHNELDSMISMSCLSQMKSCLPRSAFILVLTKTSINTNVRPAAASLLRQRLGSAHTRPSTLLSNEPE